MELSTDPRWRRSTRSNPTGGDCVEVADDVPGWLLVRGTPVPSEICDTLDTKDRDGGTLAFAATAWSAFVTLARTTSVR